MVLRTLRKSALLNCTVVILSETGFSFRRQHLWVMEFNSRIIIRGSHFRNPAMRLLLKRDGVSENAVFAEAGWRQEQC
jgi:hypothetical protein